MIVDLVELERLITLVDAINSVDPKLLRYKFLNNTMANESQLSNFDYGRHLIQFITKHPESPYPS